MMTIPWIDPYPTDAVGILENFVADAGDLHTYALLDAAFNPGPCEQLGRRWSTTGYRSVFEGRYVGKDLEAIAPRVMRLPPGHEARVALFVHLLRYTQGQPMFSLLSTPCHLDELVSHLQKQVEATDEEGRAYLLRLADTRSLALLREVLTPVQRVRWMRDIHAWGWFGRDGRWVVDIPLEPDHEREAATLPFPDTYELDAHQVRTIQQAATADTVLKHVLSSHRPMALHGSPSALHAAIVESLDKHGNISIADAVRHAMALLTERQLLSLERKK